MITLHIIVPILIISVVIFLLIIWALVAVLLLTRKKLVPEGTVTIKVNEDRVFEHERGVSLLRALSEHGVFVPSACGGAGTCGYCKGIIHSGGGDILPTEMTHLSRKEVEKKYRLFCQVKVRDDMEIQIPEEIFGIKKWECTVVSNENVATYIKEFVLQMPEGEVLDFKSGSYIQIEIPEGKIRYSDMEIREEYRTEWEQNRMFGLVASSSEWVTRAYSIANHPAENNRIMLNVRVSPPPFNFKKKRFENVNPGIASSYIFTLKPGDKVTISGPYGDFFIRENENEMMFIGGGAGMAPMRSHIFDQFLTKQTTRKTTFWYGGRSLRELFYIDDFERIEKEFPNFRFEVALSAPLAKDNWKGKTGFIHQVIFDNYLKDHPNPEDIDYYICGPKLMSEAVIRMLDSLGVSEEHIFYDDFGN
ncbi:MAG TPA: NADH:ubiquinone reductase (Na(+)-transporting) subunit F [Bacteroidales bacterium]|nr:NADH:ubiquinone reductase (Na(+)-transporting) subunit F [Bacteroidales bacterium]HQB75410.1 NADH:ubiquinone reductase (Na(+)-transporting) subunit F [Bacteroidales bacterium]HQQ20332.1 NADH:ubiquinone reductase (Na(+)-transporting) subunit F [Bacteroidales bacterium]